ncbi:hypothetical protein D9615_010041 [Tricholomella constricta]|uniref:Uncharacterized protein n=1 Tax=Tricholomella constricta TaxID=117010 RepID=A0A8H5GU55_9AGAR|nr:hypothetical protein D9615_010041 [Tricholomella constricta]
MRAERSKRVYWFSTSRSKEMERGLETAPEVRFWGASRECNAERETGNRTHILPTASFSSTCQSHSAPFLSSFLPRLRLRLLAIVLLSDLPEADVVEVLILHVRGFSTPTNEYEQLPFRDGTASAGGALPLHELDKEVTQPARCADTLLEYRRPLFKLRLHVPGPPFSTEPKDSNVE